MDFNDADFAKTFRELADVVGNCLNRTVKMVGRYRGGVLPEAKASNESIDHVDGCYEHEASGSHSRPDLNPKFDPR